MGRDTKHLTQLVKSAVAPPCDNWTGGVWVSPNCAVGDRLCGVRPYYAVGDLGDGSD